MAGGGSLPPPPLPEGSGEQGPGALSLPPFEVHPEKRMMTTPGSASSPLCPVRGW